MSPCSRISVHTDGSVQKNLADTNLISIQNCLVLPTYPETIQTHLTPTPEKVKTIRCQASKWKERKSNSNILLVSKQLVWFYERNSSAVACHWIFHLNIKEFFVVCFNCFWWDISSIYSESLVACRFVIFRDDDDVGGSGEYCIPATHSAVYIALCALEKWK